MKTEGDGTSDREPKDRSRREGKRGRIAITLGGTKCVCFRGEAKKRKGRGRARL